MVNLLLKLFLGLILFNGNLYGSKLDSINYSCISFYRPSPAAQLKILAEKLQIKHSMAPPGSDRFDSPLARMKEILAMDDSKITLLDTNLGFGKTSTVTSSLSTEFLSSVKTFTLSLENGRQSLSLIRINYVPGKGDLSWPILNDYAGISSLLPDVKFIIATPTSAVPELKKRLATLPLDFQKKVRIAAGDSPVKDWGIWAQDHSKPLESEAPRSLQLNSKELSIEAIKSAGGIEFLDFPVKLQGGNIVVGDRHVFIGPKELNSTINFLRVSKADAIRFLEASFGKKVLALSSPTLRTKGEGSALIANQRLFHLDLDLVIAVDRKTDREVALVRSPMSLMKGILGISEKVKIETAEDVMALEKQLFELYQNSAKDQSLSQSVVDFLETLLVTDPRQLLKDEMDAQYMARLLKIRGYDVKFIPGYGRAEHNLRQDIFTGTNVILSGEHALVPFNNLPELDSLVSKTYQDLGYRVHQMRSSAKTVICQGAIRCVSETYRRTSSGN